MGHYIRTLNNIIVCPQMPVDRTRSLLTRHVMSHAKVITLKVILRIEGFISCW